MASKTLCPHCGKSFVNVALHYTKAHALYEAYVTPHPRNPAAPNGCSLYRDGVKIAEFGKGFYAIDPDCSWDQAHEMAEGEKLLFWKYTPSTGTISFHYQKGGERVGEEPHPGAVAFENFKIIKRLKPILKAKAK